MFAFDVFDIRMQEGYREFSRGSYQEACRIWKEAWLMFLNLADAAEIKSIGEFDDRFAPTQFVFNWVQDYEQALGNAGAKDNSFHQERIEYCEEFLRRFEDSSDILMVQNMKRAIGESYFILGQRDKAASLFEKWLAEDPTWGWGWIGWADCWMFHSSKDRDDLEKAAAILQRGLLVDDVADKEYIYERLVDLYLDMGLPEQADLLKEIMHSHSKIMEMKKRHEEIMAGIARKQKVPRVSAKIGRNEPCPCGSGKKYKKCCGA